MARELTDSGRESVKAIARRHGVSAGAAETLLQALADGGGQRAQFSHPELGGSGQWMTSGMLMVGDMFNDALKAKVAGLCADLAALLATGTALGPAATGGGPSGDWWPAGLGTPNAAGDQNGRRYAYFSQARRLAVEDGGRVTVYDTGDHQIGGVAQQQGGGTSLAFTSQSGPVDVSRLPVVPSPAQRTPGEDSNDGAKEPPSPPAPPSTHAEPLAPPSAPPVAHAAPQAAHGDVFSSLERLADLKQKGVLTEEEFTAKKTELLGRL